MAKTRRHHGGKKHGTMRSYKTCCKATFHGLHEWQDEMFEKLGWMVLAKSKGYMNDKVKSYINSVHRLKKAIEQKMHSVHDADKKEDLEIMHHNVSVLCEHVDKDFNMPHHHEGGYHKGSPSKTHPGDLDFTGKMGLKSKTHHGDLDFTTKHGDKDFHRKGHNVKIPGDVPY